MNVAYGAATVRERATISDKTARSLTLAALCVMTYRECCDSLCRAFLTCSVNELRRRDRPFLREATLRTEAEAQCR